MREGRCGDREERRSVARFDHVEEQGHGHGGAEDSHNRNKHRGQPGSSEISSHGLGHVQPPVLYGEPPEGTCGCCRGRHKSSASWSMNPSLLAALGAFLVVVLWWRGRSRPVLPLVRNPDTSAVAALNRAQIALVQSGGARGGEAAAAASPAAAPGSGAGELPAWQAAGSAGGAAAALAALPLPPRHDSHRQRLFRSRLQGGFAAGGRQRLEAIRQARRWGHPSILPLLRQGLRATDPQVVQESAAALHRFRGRTPAASAVIAPGSLTARPSIPARGSSAARGGPAAGASSVAPASSRSGLSSRG